MAAPVDDFTARLFSAVNGMMLDMLAAISRKDYTTRRERAVQGTESQTAGKYQGRTEDTDRNQLVQKHLKAGQSSWNEIMALVGCSRGTVAKQAALLSATNP
jgi:DNA invertase Pin-like site-specific DNA recombinase